MTSDIDHSTAQAPEKQLTNTRALVIQNGPKNLSEEDKGDEIEGGGPKQGDFWVDL